MLGPLRMRRSAVARAAMMKLLASQYRNPHHHVSTSPFSYLKNLAVADGWSGVGAATPELTEEEGDAIRPYYSGHHFVEEDDNSSSAFLGSRQQQHWDGEADEHTGDSTLSLKDLGHSLEENLGAADSWWSGLSHEFTQKEKAAVTTTIRHSYSKVAEKAEDNISSRYLDSRQWAPKIITTTRPYHSGPSYSSKTVEAEDDPNISSNPIDDSACSSRRECWPSLLSNKSYKNNDVVGRTLRHAFEAKIPLAVAGPLEIRGGHAQGWFLAPMATTEGAIVASANRGAAALNRSGGGVTAYTSQLRASACPVFEAATPGEAHALGEWVKGQLEQIQREVVEAEDVYCGVELKEIISVYDLQFVHLLLKFETEEVTAQHDTISRLSSQVAKWIAQKAPKGLQLRRYWRESQLSGDKKCSRLNALLGHGLTCGAEAVIPETVLSKYLGVHSTSDLLSFYRMIERVSDRSLSMGSNGNVANITAAVFAATGQDLGSCVDAGAVRTQFTLHEGAGAGVRYTLWIPSLVIGAKEDHHPSPAQRQCLDMMGCSLGGGEGGGGNVNVRKLAEIVAAFGIALDISTIASVVAGQFTQAHEKLGKNRPT